MKVSYLSDVTLLVSARRALQDARQVDGKARSGVLEDVLEMVQELKQRADDVAEDDAATGKDGEASEI